MRPSNAPPPDRRRAADHDHCCPVYFMGGLRGIDSTVVQAFTDIRDTKEAQCHAPPQQRFPRSVEARSAGCVRSSGCRPRRGPRGAAAAQPGPVDRAALRPAFRGEQPARDRGRPAQPQGAPLPCGRSRGGALDAGRRQCQPPGWVVRRPVRGDGRWRPAGPAAQDRRGGLPDRRDRRSPGRAGVAVGAFPGRGLRGQGPCGLRRARRATAPCVGHGGAGGAGRGRRHLRLPSSTSATTISPGGPRWTPPAGASSPGSSPTRH